MLHNLTINDTKLKVGVADTKDARYKGLSDTKRLGELKGLLFIFPEPASISMVMRDMNYDLDFILLDKNWKVIQLGSLNKDSKSDITANSKTQMVLEVNKGIIDSIGILKGMIVEPDEKLQTQLKGVKKFKHGGSFEMVGDKVYEVTTDDIVVDKNKLQVLDTNGEVVANIEPGARIFSRGDTKALISKLKKGDKLKLADTMIAIINKQNNQEQEYVTK